MNKEKVDKLKNRFLAESVNRKEVGGGSVKQVKGIKSTLILMSTE